MHRARRGSRRRPRLPEVSGAGRGWQGDGDSRGERRGVGPALLGSGPPEGRAQGPGLEPQAGADTTFECPSLRHSHRGVRSFWHPRDPAKRARGPGPRLPRASTETRFPYRRAEGRPLRSPRCVRSSRAPGAARVGEAMGVQCRLGGCGCGRREVPTKLGCRVWGLRLDSRGMGAGRCMSRGPSRGS